MTAAAIAGQHGAALAAPTCAVTAVLINPLVTLAKVPVDVLLKHRHGQRSRQ